MHKARLEYISQYTCRCPQNTHFISLCFHQNGQHGFDGPEGSETRPILPATDGEVEEKLVSLVENSTQVHFLTGRLQTSRNLPNTLERKKIFQKFRNGGAAATKNVAWQAGLPRIFEISVGRQNHQLKM